MLDCESHTLEALATRGELAEVMLGMPMRRAILDAVIPFDEGRQVQIAVPATPDGVLFP